VIYVLIAGAGNGKFGARTESRIFSLDVALVMAWNLFVDIALTQR
jgi:hypothetical protein